VVFDEQQLRSFTVGSVVECFGPEYQIFEDRRIPRTPNGDLQMMSRVTEIQGRRSEFTPDTLLVSEYDIPADAWYLRDNSYPVVPYAVWMEIALQPCGFLSAYLGSLLLFPGADLYFRNLDGYGCLERPQPDLRGETVVTRARLRSSTFIQDIIIQKYAFEVQHQGSTLYAGEAVFGYFTPEALYNQIGLDASKTSQPWYVRQGQHARLQTFDLGDPATRQQFMPAAQRPHEGLAQGQLDLLDEIGIIEDGGEHGQGYIFARRRVDPEAWYFACHFFQDPVMPGSLGVEGMLQAMQAYALRRGLTRQFDSPHFEHLPGQTVSWRYRGQIVREVPEWSLEVQLSRVEVRPDEVVLVGDASLWRGDLRIYEVRGLALRVAETVEDARQPQMQTARER
jgi:3-hydroxymyristoyl/3-hydroxydecanoyl-(acyl carrier protein) dehydratase